MSQSKIPPDELLELLAGHCAGTLADEDARRLASALRSDDSAQRTFIQYMDLHSSLAWEASSVADLETMSSPVPTKTTVRDHAQSKAQRVLRFFVATRFRVALTVASCFVVVLLSLAAFTPAPLFNFARDAKPSTDGDRVVAARITGGVDCRWQETALPLGFGSSLYKGQQVELLSGSAEITFDSGAVITLAGPAVYVIDSNRHSSLRVGELSAQVPRRAKGFSVQTPAAMVVDLGTEFGIVVHAAHENDGPATEEIHVFQGTVEYSLRNSTAEPQRLTANQAVRIAPNRHVEQLSAARRESFPPSIAAADGDTTTGEALPKNQHPPITRGLTLWLSADGAVRLGANNTVDVWEDMLTGDNTKAQNAYPLRSENQPRLVAEAINGRAAIRFDGDDYLTLATPSDFGILNGPYEMFIVARTSSPAIQFLIGGGVTDFELHLNGDAGARFIPAGYDAGAGASDWGANQQFSDGQPHLFAARILVEGDHQGIVQVDGRDSSDLTIGDRRSVNNTSLRLGMRYDGGYPLNGEIAEVLIYRGQLTITERNSVGRFLSEKYQIEPSE